MYMIQMRLQKARGYDQEMPQSQTEDHTTVREEEKQNTNSHKAKQLKSNN